MCHILHVLVLFVKMRVRYVPVGRCDTVLGFRYKYCALVLSGGYAMHNEVDSDAVACM